MKKLFWSVSFACVGLISCNPASEFEKEISQIDSCLNELDKIEEVYAGINFDSLQLMVNHVVSNEDSIHKYYNPDTLDMEFGQKMTASKGIRKKMEGVATKKESFYKEMTELKKQLSDLKEDILNGVFDHDQVNNYLSAELKDMNKFSLTFYEFNDIQIEQSNVYYVTVPFIDQYILELKEKSGQME